MNVLNISYFPHRKENSTEMQELGYRYLIEAFLYNFLDLVYSWCTFVINLIIFLSIVGVIM